MSGLINLDGTPLRKKHLTEEIAAPSLTGVRQVLSGHPAQGLTPRRLAQLLLSAESGDPTSYFELAEEMEEKDLHYLGVLGARKRAITGLELEVIAAEDAPDANRHADFIRDILARDELSDELFDIMDAVGKGISLTEIIWETNEKEWRPIKFEWRDPRWFQFDRVDGRTPLIRNGGDGEPLPNYKFITHIVRAKSGLPLRGGIARAAAWGYLFKNYSVKDWVVFAEVYGQPMRVGKFHSSATEEDKKILARAVSMIGTDAAAIIPDSMLIEFVKDSNQTGSADVFERLADWMDRQVSKAVLGQTTTTDAISGGHAVSKEHQEVRRDIQEADAKQLAGTLNRDLVIAAIDLNFGPQKRYPKIRLPIPEAVDLVEYTTGIKNATEAGLRIGAKHVRDKMGIPEPEAGEEILSPLPAQSSVPEKTKKALASAEVTNDDDLIDQLAAQIIDEEGFKLIKPTLQPVLELAAASANFEEFSAGLSTLVENMDTKGITEALARSMFAANAAGELDIAKK